jgi:hypothetical protein
MIFKKDSVQIINENNTYKIYIKKTQFKVFNTWIPLTFQETENSPEKELEFNSLNEAEEFIDNYLVF